MSEKLVVLEDEGYIATGIINLLNLPDVEYFSSLDEFEMFLERQVHEEQLKCIFDMNLGDDKKRHDGLKAIELLGKHSPDSIPVLYTAYSEYEVQKYCKELQIHRKYFYLTKEDLEEDTNKMKSLLNLPSGYNEIDESRITNRSFIIQEEKIADKVQKRVVEGKVDLVRISFDTSIDFEDLDVSSKKYFCRTITSPYGFIDDYIHTGKSDFFISKQKISDLDSSESHSVVRITNKISGVIEGIVLQDGVGSLICFLPKVRSAMIFFESHQDRLQEDSFLGYMLRAVIIDRLSFLFRVYYRQRNNDIESLSIIFDKLPEPILKKIIFNVWETITIQETLDAVTTNKILKELMPIDFGVIELDDIFYGEVISFLEEDIIETRVSSIQSIKTKFNKIFMLRNFEEVNVKQVGACFKLYVFKKIGDKFSEPENSFLIERISVNIFEHITKN